VAVVGWIGLGKLGAPCAAALAHEGSHTLVGYDVRGVDPTDYDWDGLPPITLVNSIEDVIQGTDRVVYVAVQTPHAPRYGGEKILFADASDFEYGYLVTAVRDVCRAAQRQRKNVTLVVVSTVLPGTFDRHLRPLLNEYVTPVYHPFFIAMGTVVDDFTRPEMLLFGADHEDNVEDVADLYDSIHDAPQAIVSISSAELTKVAYNTFITSKIVFANTIMQLAEYTGADVDEVTDSLRLATDRVISHRYLSGGMGDGGACHPRDNVALSALAQRHDLTGNLFYQLTQLREDHSLWLARIIKNWYELTGLSIVILGRAYKPELAMDAGSPALLLREHLNDYGLESQMLDPVMNEHDQEAINERLRYPHIFFVATLHARFRQLTFSPGSVVIDPFGALTPQSGVTLITPGRRRNR